MIGTFPQPTPRHNSNSYGAAIYSGDADDSLTDMAVDLASSVSYVAGACVSVYMPGFAIIIVVHSFIVSLQATISNPHWLLPSTNRNIHTGVSNSLSVTIDEETLPLVSDAGFGTGSPVSFLVKVGSVQLAVYAILTSPHTQMRTH